MDPTLVYCEVDKHATYQGASKKKRDMLAAPNLQHSWLSETSKGARALVWREQTSETQGGVDYEEMLDYTDASTDVDPESLLVTPYGDGVSVDRQEWLEEYEGSLPKFFGHSTELFYSSKSLLFANIDAVVDFTRRTGGFVANSEIRGFPACFTGSLALAGLGYTLYRVPMADVLYLTEKRVAPFWIPMDAHYVIESYSARFHDTPWGVPGPFVATSAIGERFGERLKLLVGDYDFPLRDIERVLDTDGHLLLFLPGDVDSDVKSLLTTYRDVISEVAIRFSKFVVFSPLALLGRGLVVVASQVHRPYKADSSSARSVAASVDAYLESVEKSIRAQFSLPWTDVDFYNHERAAIVWNAF